MSKKEDAYKAEGSRFELDLAKLVGSPVKAIHGYISKEFGDPVFKLTKVIMEGGREFHCEGEHDMPYLVTYGRDPAWNDLLEQLADEDEESAE